MKKFMAIFTGNPGDKNRIDPIPAEAADAYLDEAYTALPWMGRLGLRVSIAVVGMAAPLVTFVTVRRSVCVPGRSPTASDG